MGGGLSKNLFFIFSPKHIPRRQPGDLAGVLYCKRKRLPFFSFA
jgi:hypothetical protein